MNVHGVANSLTAISELKTALDVRSLRDSAATPEVIAEKLRDIRAQTYNLKHVAERLTEQVERSPRLCGGVLVLIERRLAYSRVNYDLFDEIVDKDFMAKAVHDIRHQTAAILATLDIFDIVQINDMVFAHEQIDDLTVFVEHVDTVLALPALQQKLHTELTQRAILAAIAAVTVALAVLSAWVFTPWLVLLWLVIGAVAALSYRTRQQEQLLAYTRMAKSCEKDFDRVRGMLQRYKSKEIAKRELEEHKRVVKAFFGDMSPLSQITGIFSVIQMHINLWD